MKIFLGSDHAGFALKNSISAMLSVQGHEVQDLGAHALDPADDYPATARAVARAVAAEPSARGVLFGMSGQGEAMAANRVGGARAVVFYGGPTEVLELSRAHNDANILSLGARFVAEAEAHEAVALWLAAPFSGEERHARRIAQIDAL